MAISYKSITERDPTDWPVGTHRVKRVPIAESRGWIESDV
ncbi:hypothetical protein C489_10993 [Natrinema versiforme JCM 10478]|uniref:Uncharacterized protein n=1 Tax=Natrinema versiforme JCM 10478 TaxID=1227496 RepID=L9XZK3_9EURY|nr:hypothetical protein C489_10993 [Natrinema versiforme JCM 10478]